jgi:hypothetical protein
VGHRVKIHNITSATDKERGDLEIKDYVVMQKPQPQATRLPPPRTLIMDYTMTHIRFGRSHLHHMGQLTNTRRSDGGPDPDVGFKEVVRIKIRHYRNLYLNHPDPIVFLPLTLDTTGRMYDEFIRLLFLHDHREASVLVNELSEESDQFRFLHASCFANLKGAVGLIMTKDRLCGFQYLWTLTSTTTKVTTRFANLSTQVSAQLDTVRRNVIQPRVIDCPVSVKVCFVCLDYCLDDCLMNCVQHGLWFLINIVEPGDQQVYSQVR